MAKKTPFAPPAPGRPTMPAQDAANPETPLTLSSDAIEGTRDRLLAMDWTDEGHLVRKRDDGVYERLHVSTKALPVDETYEFYPDVEMLDRRVLDPTIDRGSPILFRDEVNIRAGQQPKYYKRWIDTHIPSRFQILTQQAHYKVATWDMLANKNDIGDRAEGIGNEVCRGEKGRYKLIFMPYVKWLEIKVAEAHLRTRNERTQMTRLAAERAGKDGKLGPNAGEQIDSMFIGGVKELPPQSLETFQGSGLPKDLATGGATVLEE